jgi:hypothetical protein
VRTQAEGPRIRDGGPDGLSRRDERAEDRASGGDLGLQDGRRRLVEVAVWLRWEPG